jgi:SAM-dependent methyltransferase
LVSKLPASPSWYLDPLVAEQKRRVHQDWIRGSIGGHSPGIVLKTDLFEEAYGPDRILHDLFPQARLALGVDLDLDTARAATRDSAPFAAAVCDVRALPLPPECIDVIVSTSTLDHFEVNQALDASVDELARVLRPQGVLLITVDNPRNPLYHALRWASRRGWTPFRLGQTVSRSRLVRMLEARGFRIQSTQYLIHNPRLISTLLFLGLRRTLGRYAALPIRALLSLFALLGRLPIRTLTGCFVAICAIKPAPAVSPRLE